MKRIKNLLLSVFLIIVLPMMVHAHPGHDHSGNSWEIFQHFVVTYYIYFIAVFALLAGLARYYYLMVSKQKSSQVQESKDKK